MPLLRAGQKTRIAEPIRFWLIDHFVKLRTKHFRKALMRWREWKANDFGEQLRRNLQLGFSAATSTTGEACISSTKTAGLASAREV